MSKAASITSEKRSALRVKGSVAEKTYLQWQRPSVVNAAHVDRKLFDINLGNLELFEKTKQ